MEGGENMNTGEVIGGAALLAVAIWVLQSCLRKISYSQVSWWAISGILALALLIDGFKKK